MPGNGDGIVSDSWSLPRSGLAPRAGPLGGPDGVLWPLGVLPRGGRAPGGGPVGRQGGVPGARGGGGRGGAVVAPPPPIGARIVGPIEYDLEIQRDLVLTLFQRHGDARQPLAQ